MANNIQIGADTSGFVSGVNRASSAMSGLGRTITNATSGNAFSGLTSGLKDLLAGVSIIAAVKTAAQGMYSAMEAGGALVDLSAQTGVAIDTLMQLQVAFKQCGMAASDVQPVLSKLQKQVTEAATGSADAIDKFSRMGIAIEDIQGLSADEQLAKVGDAISKIENPAQRAAMAVEIFGRSGAKMLAVFASGGLADAQKNLGQQAQLMAQNAGVFDRVTDVLGTAGEKLQGFFVGVASEVAPQLMGAVEAINGLDLSFIGQAFGNAIAFWINYFQNFGTQGELISNTLKLAFMEAVNSLNDALQTTWVQVYSNLKLAFGNAINFLVTEMSVAFARVAAAFKSMLPGGGNMEEETKKAEAKARSKAPPIDTDKLSREADDARFFVPKPLFDTTSTEAAMQRDMDKIEASKQATAEKARKENPFPNKPDSGLGYIPKANIGPVFAGGMPDISSLQKIGGGSGLLAGGQDNSPAYQSVRIQEDIRDYIKDLIQTVKQGGQSYQTPPNMGGALTLTA